MSVEIWYGEQPHNETEQDTLVELYQYLQSQPEPFVLLHNFFAGRSNEIDLLVLKRNCVFLAELKHVWTPIVGGCEGDWKAIGQDGSEITLNPDRPNPFKQARRNYYTWKEWCESNADKISQGIVQARPTDWSSVRTCIVLCPELPTGSKIEIGERPIQAAGLPEFLLALVMHSKPKVNLSEQEMSRIPELLKLHRWTLPHSTKKTEKLTEWQPAPFAVLVSRGHALSRPLFNLDEIGKEAIAVGREPGNDVVINDPTVSRQHAEICKQDGRWIVRDLGSTSGTFLCYNGDPSEEKRVRDIEFALKNNSIVRFGAAAYTLLLYERERS